MVYTFVPFLWLRSLLNCGLGLSENFVIAPPPTIFILIITIIIYL